MERLVYLLAALAEAIRRLFRAKEQREAQDERNQIDQDSAQYSADKFGDGRVRPIPGDATEADKAQQRDGDGG